MASTSLPLRAQIMCPHCWHRFAPQDVLWVSVHPELRGDPRVGEDAQQRFLPSRFDVQCRALDVRGEPCNELACPNCHLTIPRALLELKPLLVSILGAPGSGKSYYLAASVWQMRQTFSEYFRIQFSDADPVANQVVIDYEERLFLNPDADQPVMLPKTEKDGQLYESVRFDDRVVWFPKPFLFTIRPEPDHPNADRQHRLARVLCLYDNAGEHFLPGGETPNTPGTAHLGHSEALLFLFDPTQHPRFREACQAESRDPQMQEHGWAHRQDHVLSEAAKRIRARTNLPESQKLAKPLIVVVTKYDAWEHLMDLGPLELERVIPRSSSGMGALHTYRLQQVSQQVRQLLLKYAREVVVAAEALSQKVLFVPVSALGTPPEVLESEQGQALGVRPKNIRPMWVEIPFFYLLYRCVPGLLPRVKGTD